MQENQQYFSRIFQNFLNFFDRYLYINNIKNIIILGGSGWADPTNWAGPSPKGLGRSRPNKVFYFLSGPDLAQTAGMGQNQSGPQTQGWARTSLAQRRKNQQCRARISLARQHNIKGELFSPFPSYMQNAVRSACRGKTKVQTIRREKSYLAWRRWCVAGLAASLAVLRWRPVAVLWLTGGGSKQ